MRSSGSASWGCTAWRIATGCSASSRSRVSAYSSYPRSEVATRASAFHTLGYMRGSLTLDGLSSPARI